MGGSLLTECPNAAMLAEYVSGALDESAAESVVTHLQQCAGCQSRVDGMLAGSDSLLAVLRGRLPFAHSNNGADLAEMIQRAHQLRPAGDSQPTRSSSSDGTSAAGPRRAAVDLPTFLAGLRRSRLMPRNEIDELLATRRPRDSAGLAAELIERRLLTPFQARCLLRGAWKGLVLGNYVILDKLGEGGMARVFKAKHRKMGRVVCLKILPRSARRNRELLERFRREAQTIAALDHANIVVGHDADEADGILFLVMEYIDGRDLARVVREDGPLGIDAALDVILQSARALGHVHAQGIVHRDIKPHNLLLDKAGTVKILDMGIARFDPLLGENPDGISQATMTGTDVVMGTIDYMSPEQALNLRFADERSDVYSLGCTLYFLLTGKTLFSGTTMMEKLVAHREQPPPRLSEFCPQATPGLEAVFARMVAKDPEQRYAAMPELIDDIIRLQQGSRPRSQRIAPVGRLRGRSRLLAGGVLVAVLLAGATWFARIPESAGPDDVTTAPESVDPAEPATPLIVGHPATIANGGPGRVLLFVTADHFYDDHYRAITAAMEERGVEWAVASSRAGTAIPKHGQIPPVAIDVSLPELEFDPNDYDGVVFIGGNVLHEFGHKAPNAQQIIRETLETCLQNDRFAAAIGDGVQAISDCRLLDGAACESQDNVWVYHAPEWSGTIFKAVDPLDAAELVDLMLPPARPAAATKG